MAQKRCDHCNREMQVMFHGGWTTRENLVCLDCLCPAFNKPQYMRDKPRQKWQPLEVSK